MFNRIGLKRFAVGVVVAPVIALGFAGVATITAAPSQASTCGTYYPGGSTMPGSTGTSCKVTHHTTVRKPAPVVSHYIPPVYTETHPYTPPVVTHHAAVVKKAPKKAPALCRAPKTITKIVRVPGKTVTKTVVKTVPATATTVTHASSVTKPKSAIEAAACACTQNAGVRWALAIVGLLVGLLGGAIGGLRLFMATGHRWNGKVRRVLAGPDHHHLND
jgi:hypothetical protein